MKEARADAGAQAWSQWVSSMHSFIGILIFQIIHFASTDCFARKYTQVIRKEAQFRMRARSHPFSII